MITIVSFYQNLQQHKGIIVDTTSHSGEWSQLSPFLLGPCQLYGPYTSKNMENGWQYSKVYLSHIDVNITKETPDKDLEKAEVNLMPSQRYWDWAKKGWATNKAIRYPMGKGATPAYALWNGQQLNYIEARKKIYVPLYAKAVTKTNAYKKLKELHQSGKDLILRDYDGYDHKNKTLREVMHDPRKKMGHAFVLKMLLTNDPCLSETDFNPKEIT